MGKNGKNKKDDFFDCFDTTKTIDDVKKDKSTKKKKHPKNLSNAESTNGDFFNNSINTNREIIKELNEMSTKPVPTQESDLKTLPDSKINRNKNIDQIIEMTPTKQEDTTENNNIKVETEVEERLTKQEATECAKIEREKLARKMRMFSIGSKNKQKKTTIPVEKVTKDLDEEIVDNSVKSTICCILGHVDTGKTKILDKLRQTDIQGNEAGGITQQIGATFFPLSLLKKKSPNLKSNLPGILIIDTPGHETFSNLRSRGSSLCNLAILVVDILHGLEPQTIESIELLKKGKTYFIIALNKIDRIIGWVPYENSDFRTTLSKQSIPTQREFKNLLKESILRFSEIGLNVSLFYENINPRQFLNLIPTSAITGEGLPDLIENVVYLSEKFFKKKLQYKEEFECTMLECDTLEGYGNTVDAILSSGELFVGDKIILCSLDGAIVTTVKHILVPEPRVLDKKISAKIPLRKKTSIRAAAGLKIVANNLENVVAGTKILKIPKNCINPDNIEDLKKEVMADYKTLMSNTSETGVHIQSSTLGSLEALINFVESKNIPIASVGVGHLTKTSILKSALIREKGYAFGAILCFNIKVDKELEELAKQKGIKILKSEIIYNLIDEYLEYIESVKLRNKKIHKVVYPFQLKIIPTCIFTKRSPLVLGVEILRGKLALNSRVFVKTSEITKLGIVTSIEKDKQAVELAIKGDKVAIKIENSEAPKVIGRHFQAIDILESYIDKNNISLLKTTFSDDLNEDEWNLIHELQQKLGMF